jgi:hypothetical protein
LRSWRMAPAMPFVHVSVAERSGHGSVPPGATLEVRTSPGPKGPQVTEMISVDATTACKSRLDVRDRIDRHIRRATAPPSKSWVR